jgi:hypothetical protein
MCRPLVEFMLGLDGELRVNSGADRALQREALRDRLPDAIRQRTSKGAFQAIYDRAFRDNPDWLRILTDSPRLVKMGWVDGPLWAEAVARARFGVVTRRPEFDAAITTECWLRNYEMRASPAPAIKFEAAEPQPDL